MKNIIFAIILSVSFSCNQESKNELKVYSDNKELIDIYKKDQSDRTNIPMDWRTMQNNDRLREKRVEEMIDSNLVHTSLDYHNAALVFHHGRDSIAFEKAINLMKKSIELDSLASKWLLAAAIDRYLLSTNKPQIYGTQTSNKFDTTKVSDSERLAYGVPTLAQQKENDKFRHHKPLSRLMKEGISLDSLIYFIKQEDITKTQYDISERGINRFAYQIKKQGKIIYALKIFKLNTDLYPKRYNVFDSYGECLLNIGKKEKAIIAYKKSLELNPENRNARKVLLGMK